MIWLWTVLIQGEPGLAYNVGSEKEISIADLAQTVSNITGTEIEGTISSVSKSDDHSDRYVPDTTRARSKLNLEELISLDDAIRRTIIWNKLQG